MKPYGADAGSKYDQWIKQRKLRYSPSGHCLHWLKSGRCNVFPCMDGGWDWMDHTSGYIDPAGHRTLICQPYNFSDVASLAAACKRLGLRAVVHGLGWYGHSTVCIELITEATFQHKMEAHAAQAEPAQ
jgi:hypothetical protein